MMNGGFPPASMLYWEKTALVTAGPLNAPVVVNTGNLGYSSFFLRLQYTRAAATALTWAVQRKSPVTNTLGSVTTQVFDSTGLATAGVYHGILPVAASGEFDIDFPIVSDDLTITFQGTGATGSDTLSVYIGHIRVLP